MKKHIILMLSLIFIFTCLLCPTTVFADDKITLVIDCHEVETDVPPIIQNNRTLVPLRFIAEQLGFEVGWNAEERKAKITDRNTSIELQINNTLAIVNKNFQPSTEVLDVPPIIHDNRTMVPVRFISEIMGYRVEWIPDPKTVVIYSGIRECTYEPPIPMPEPFIQESDGRITEEVLQYLANLDLDKTDYTLTSKLLYEGFPTTGQLVKKGNVSTLKAWLKGTYIGSYVCDFKSKTCVFTDAQTNKKENISAEEAQVDTLITKGKELLTLTQNFIAMEAILNEIYPNKAFVASSDDKSKITLLVSYDETKKEITSTDIYIESTNGDVYQLTMK